MNINKKNALVLETIYSLFLYLLINSPKNTYFFVEKTFFDLNKNIFENINSYEIIRIEKNLKRAYFYNKIKKIFDNRYLRNYFSQKKKNYEYIYGLDHTLIGNFFIDINFILLEDGTSNYTINKEKKINKIKRIIMGRNLDMGRDKRIKKIYLTGLAPIPEEIKNKVEIVNLKELWNKKTKEEQEEILDIFNFDFEIIEKIKKRRIILFTQPLSEDKVITEDEKINLYKKIIKNYNINQIILKKHPREITDYKKYFDIEILDQSFPSELLSILDINFKKAVTIFSTAACTLSKDIEVDFYGTEVHPKLLERFGSLDNVMKRNAFIEEDYNE